MEKAKISPYQLFVLILLFELGSALLVPTAIDAKQDAWIAILIAMVGGLCLFLIYHRLFLFYPKLLLTEYTQEILGKGLGRAIALLYILYFLYISARILRSFGEMLLAFAYPETPMFIANALLIIAVVYAVRKGIEVLARAGELFFVLMYFLALTGFILIVVSGLIDLTNLRPILEEGFMPILKSAFIETLYFPFGELIAFTMIFPYSNHPKKVKLAGIVGLVLSGINLSIVMIVNVAVLGVDLTTRSSFPLLSTIQSIEVAEFIQRLDVYFMLGMIIGSFFKIGIYLYVAVIGMASLFNIKESSRIVYPSGLVVLFLSMIIASNFIEHSQEGVKLVPIILHIPFQVVIPIFLLVVAILRNKMKDK